MMRNHFLITLLILISFNSITQTLSIVDNPQHGSFERFVKAYFPDKLTSFELIDSIQDQIGFVHYKYQQYYGGYPVQHKVLITHTKDKIITSFNDNLTRIPTLNLNLLKSGEEAIIIEQHQLSSKKIHAINKVILDYGDFFGLCYKFELSDVNSSNTYINYYTPETYELIKTEHLTHYFQSEGVGQTLYSGEQTITTDSLAENHFRLRDYSRGNGIETYTLNNSTDTTTYTDIIDTDNNWDTFDQPEDQYAIDAHWGALKTYDYFLSQHNRNSIDNKGHKLVSLLHYGTNFPNAFWDGKKMIYGDGNNNIGPLVSLDIVGHEITHGLTSNSAMLILEDESGALNESFSDLFGVLIDWYARPLNANWTLGEEVSQYIRSLSNPEINNDPKFYKGNNWKTLGGTDLGGIHSNSGVQNHWFYLVVNGGDDINEIGNAYTVTGIGLEKAAQIIYRNLTVYLTPTSNYEDARFYSIQSAQDLYGVCSAEVKAVTNAWYAVGVGESYVEGNMANFEISYHTACKPFTVNFKNTSQNAKSFLWDFGNGFTSTETHPSYTYNETGTFTVSLTALSDEICGATSSKSFMDTIVVTEVSIPKTDTLKTCLTSTTIDLTSENTTVFWYSDSLAENLLDTNRILSVNDLIKDTIFHYDVSILTTGKTDFSNLGSYNFDARHQLFDVFEPLELKAVTVYAYTVGNRTIELRDRMGNVLQTKTVYISSAGENRIPLNFIIFPGKDYQLGVSGTNIGLGRSSGGINYPYEIPHLISIHRSNAQSAGFSYYYFFYKWEIKRMNCNIKPNQYYIKVESANPTNKTIRFENGILVSEDSTHNYQWYNCGKAAVIANETTSSFTPTENGSYALIISNSECNRTDTTECFSLSNLSIDHSTKKEMTIYPNPTSNKIYIQHLPHTIQRVIIKDITGKIIYSDHTISNNSIDLSSFKTGVYILTFKMENGETMNKRIVKN